MKRTILATLLASTVGYAIGAVAISVAHPVAVPHVSLAPHVVATERPPVLSVPGAAPFVFVPQAKPAIQCDRARDARCARAKDI
ncbi:hypothetical protein [Burkholderia multivorans]|uniref:hypothetical protein n=1 Tax=Burkholderia multivorans TaxID=87883 RepID=UPI0021C1BF85|nr:hypothetical protein [Burkholderia multivorans]